MSYIQHEAMIVTSFDKKILREVREKAIQIFGHSIITEIVKPIINHYESFMIGTSGSKADCDEDIAHKKKIDLFIEYVNGLSYTEDKSDNPVQYVVVCYGDCGAEIKLTNQVNRFDK